MLRKNRVCYFKKGDLVIYTLLIVIFSFLIYKITTFKKIEASKAEIYVNGKLKYIYPLETEEKNFFVQTDIGGVNIRIKNKMIRVLTSNSPLKLDVKQGWIKEPGEMIIGIPDRLVIKIVGDSKDNTTNDVDYVIR